MATPKPQTSTQSGTGGKSASQNTRAGSSSRPDGACKFTIPSSAPASKQKIRG